MKTKFGTQNLRSLVAGLIVSIIMIALIPVQFSSAQSELETIQTEGTSKAESSFEAENAIKQQVKAKIAREQVIAIVGEKGYQKNRSLIESRIIREADRFIPMINTGKMERVGELWKLPLTISVSTVSLRQMIIDNGLLMDAEGPATILPMIEVSDRVRGQKFRWWMNDADEKKTLTGMNQNLQSALFKELNNRGFYVLRPQSVLLASAVPESYRSDRFLPEDIKFWGDFYNAQMVIKGDVRVRESTAISGGYQIAVKLNAVQTNNARTVAEVTRSFETEAGNQDTVVRAKLQTALPEVAKDLGAQIVEAWQKGTLGSNRLRLSVRGRLGPKQINDFKSQIAKAVTEIKGVRERLMEPGHITFEIDYAGNTQQLSDKVKALQLPGFSLRLAGASENLITVDITNK